ncbi:MAG: 1-acyl-sn-glycerol-3-phosphate acyltransferase [Cyclobacteriaceae bacterium]|nr:1-acyl-sn-glycerol-3-phosphate acyltransferase [Cyclobacteriaceae bacterium]
MLETAEKKSKKQYKPIHESSRSWPVVRLNKHRKEFIEEVIEKTIESFYKNASSDTEIIEELEATLYREKLRMRANPWRVDPKDDHEFWEGMKKKLLDLTTGKVQNNEYTEKDLLRSIVTRYANEIAGKFKPSKYRLARSIVKNGFSRLLNATRVKGLFAIFKNDYTLNDKIHIYGKTDLLRELAMKGTVVMVPTHFSNLDSVLIGWIIHTLGLPPFIYGAGLNLFNIKIFAYFMNSVGAYKVDRRKKNKLYIETLKMYSSQAIQMGAHSLFFPGGTRSRSGRIEKKLKRGLLGTTIEAQRSLLMKEEVSPRKIFIVPVTINYNFVLEAPVLINDYLKETGQERFYTEQDEYSTSYRIVKFLIKFFTKDSIISVSIGKPMDVLGNYVNDQGESLDKNDNHIRIKDYFTSNGKIVEDLQREEEYTRMLSQRIVEEYHRINRVFASHLVAYAAFNYWRSKFPALDLYNFLRLPEEELTIDFDEFTQIVNDLREKIYELKRQDKIKVAKHLKSDIVEVVKRGINNVGMYHVNRPLLLNKEGKVITKSLTNLYFYHNRLDGYDL